ncbi:hypothetical protein SLS60_001883 [Paraconiothyrium brasiliense]|uniref:Uncharacterized protein n=1 Tax=Paraconiothyrium brasiliense TaxID=300254 RepID=A0ABR3S142_9PLEO
MTAPTDHFPFLQLPGELHNQIYRKILRLDDTTNQVFALLKTPDSSTEGSFTSAWTLSQVTQLRYELLPLVHPARIIKVTLCDLAQHAQVFYASLKVAQHKNQLTTPSPTPLFPNHTAKLKIWTSPKGVHARLPPQGVDLLPILHALPHCHSIELGFHSWCEDNGELAILQTMHERWDTWRADISKLGVLNMHLHKAYDRKKGGWSYYGRRSSSITLRCTHTAHTSEKKRVLDLCAWIWRSGIRPVHEKVVRLRAAFVTRKTKRGQASEMVFSVFENSVKME